METGLYGHGKLILAIMAICSQTWHVVKRLARDTEWLRTRSPPRLRYIRLRLPVTEIHVKSNKIAALNTLTRVMANVFRADLIEQTESFNVWSF